MPKRSREIETPTDAEWALARRLDDAEPTVREAIVTTIRHLRGKQKAPTKQLISLRVEPDVLEAYRSTGKGWQSRMNDTLAAHAPHRGARKRLKTTPVRRAR